MTGPRMTGWTRRSVLIALPAAGVPAGRIAFSQATRPEGPVTLLVGATAGTGLDIIARLLAPHLSQRIGQPVVVENRTGASGVLAAQAVARAPADGRLLLIVSDPFVITPGLMGNLPFDPIAHFSFVTNLAFAPVVLGVKADFPGASVAELLAEARRNPGRLTYASPGNGTPHHMIMELFKLTTGVDITHVPYRGTAQAIQDLLGRRVDCMVIPVHVAMPHAREGRIKVVASFTDRRLDAAPEVPTLREAGVAMDATPLFYALLAPPGLPEPLLGLYNAEVTAWLRLPEVIERLSAQGMIASGSSPEELRAQIQRDIARWTEVVRRANIRVD